MGACPKQSRQHIFFHERLIFFCYFNKMALWSLFLCISGCTSRVQVPVDSTLSERFSCPFCRHCWVVAWPVAHLTYIWPDSDGTPIFLPWCSDCDTRNLSISNRHTHGTKLTFCEQKVYLWKNIINQPNFLISDTSGLYFLKDNRDPNRVPVSGVEFQP